MPLGFITDESQVNTTATGNQRAPATAALTNGGYVTVWASDAGDGSGKAIMGQRFAADGSKVGAEFLINTTIAGDQDLPDVVAYNDVSSPGGVPNSFIVVWQSAEAGGSVIRGRRFLEDGTPARFSPNDQSNLTDSDVIVSGTFGGTKPSAGLYGTGRLAIVWEAPSGDGDGTAIVMAQYRSGLQAPAVANIATAGNQINPRIADIPGVGATIVWESQEPGGDVIRARIHAQANVFVIDAIVNEAADEDESLPNVGEGGTLVIWNSGTNIMARDVELLNARATPTGSAFILNTTPGGVISRSDILGFNNGNYLAVYFTHEGDDGSSYSIRAEYFNRSAGPQTAEFLVPQSFAGAQEAPTVVRLAGGNIIVTWASEADELGNFEIRQRLLSLDAPQATEGSDTINGTAGDDVLNGLGGNDTINGLGGDDLIDGGTGDDVMDGGDGTDTVTYATATGPVTISLANTDPQSNGDAGTDTLIGFENVTGSPFADILIGTDGPNVIDGGAGGDSMTGGDGDDVYHVDDAGDSIVEAAGEGIDEVRTSLATYTLAATLENLTATNAITHTFRGHGGDNRITGGEARDLLYADDGGNDTLIGLGGNDSLIFLATFDANDYVDGGAGGDAIILQGDYSAGLTFGTGTTSNIVGVESLALAPGDFTGFGGSWTGLTSYNLTMLDSNVAPGGAFKVNAFTLRADENLTFDGSAETDGRFTILAGLGTDDLTGGGGADLFLFGHDGRFAPGDKVEGGGGYDNMYLRGDYVIDFNDAAWANALSGIESVTLGGAADDRFFVGGDGEFDYAFTWNDALLAGGLIVFNGSRLGAAETMMFDGRTEASANFRLWGGAADDVLRGGGAADLLYGGNGGDTLQGNGGNDEFRYYSVSESNVSGLDGIQDFTLGDLINLSGIDANELVAGDQAFTFVTGAFTGPGQLRVVGSGGLVTVEANVNGDTLADLSIAVVVADLHSLTASDFIL